MSIIVNRIKMPLTSEPEMLRDLFSKQYGVPVESVHAIHLRRSSLDARKKSDIFFQVSAIVEMEPVWEKKLLMRNHRDIAPYVHEEKRTYEHGTIKPRGRIAVIGLGPAGLFAAYLLAKEGYQPLVIERGAPISQRVKDVEHFWQDGVLQTESNVLFGEGGAGTFSDGKLTTRIKDPRAQEVIAALVQCGAPQEIAIQAKPHIGTDMLRGVVTKLRKQIEALGGEVRFFTRLTDITASNRVLQSITVEKNGEQEKIPCCACVLAIGHSARDTYTMLHEAGLELVPKAFAVGVRIEHPQKLIDAAQYGAYAGHPRLGAAEYRLSGRSGERGVYTFCMCPGGQVVASASAKEQVAVNGMSNFARNAPNANSAIVVQVSPNDFGTGVFDGIRFQEMLENAAFRLGSGGFAAPAQRVEDFLKNRKTTAFGDVKPSYRPGVTGSQLQKCLPDFIAAGIADGIRAFSRQLRGFDFPDAVLTAVESRTSAPIRILRDVNGEATNVKGLYPTGEGAGYAGGIVSAAVDGLHAAEKIISRYQA